jgi:hypothetical protein
MEAAAIYKPLLSKDELEVDSVAPGREEIKQRYLAAVTNPSICGQEFWARVPNDLEAKRVYNADVDAIIKLLDEKNAANDTGIVVWVLGRSPNSTNLKFKHKLHHLLGMLAPRDMKHSTATEGPKVTSKKTKSGSESKNGKGAAHDAANVPEKEMDSLFIVLSAENQFYYDETSPRVLAAVADPFATFWQHWFDYFKDHKYVQQLFREQYPHMKDIDLKTFGPIYQRLKLPRVRIYHHVTWAEVVSSAFVEVGCHHAFLLL